MQLHLLRHAKTKQESPTGKDYDRSLMERGWHQCAELNTFLSTQNFSQAKVICSGAKRTRETLAGIEQNFDSHQVEFRDELYLCSLEEYLKTIWSQSGSRDLFLIGHNFGISDLANYFLDTYLEMKTAEYICIEFPFDDWNASFQSTGTLKNRFRPEAK